MTGKDKLLNRLIDHEDSFTERKPESVGTREIKRTLVAFANSVPEGRTAVLFIGVRENGQVSGVKDTDKKQHHVADSTQDCYPQVRCLPEVLEVDGKSVVAVVVPPSSDRPHFAGRPFVRVGSRNEPASEEAFQELVASRTSKVAELLRWKKARATVAVQVRGKFLGTTKRCGAGYRATYECQIQDCTAHRVTFYWLGEGRRLSEPLENVTITFDDAKNREMVIVQEGNK